MSKAPPQRVRVTKLSETQIDAIVAIDRAAKEPAYRAGVAAADWPARTLAGFVALTKMHNVLVAEADGVIAGYAAWRDESPGVAYLEDIAVRPDLQRVGVGSNLLGSVRDEARNLGLPVLIARCWTKAPSGPAFFAKERFAPIGSVPHERVGAWRDEQSPLAAEGQAVLVALL
jgi:amino-acid N-acetyltransferase